MYFSSSSQLFRAQTMDITSRASFCKTGQAKAVSEDTMTWGTFELLSMLRKKRDDFSSMVSPRNE